MRALLLLLLLAFARPSPARDVPIVAAAADLRYAMEDLAAAFRRAEGREVRLVFGSSGTFHQQIMSGAPYQLYLSADEAYVQRLAKAGKTVDGGALYAIGRIALVAPPNAKFAVDPGLNGLKQALAKGQIKHFAIANPDHAPYGQRAEEALRHASLWRPLQPRLVIGENVAQALQFVTTGGAEGGIVALSLVRSPAFKGLGQHAVIPAKWHQPLRQRMVLTKGAGETARLFYRWLQQPAARAIFARYGFERPAQGD